VNWDANGWQSILYDVISLWRSAPVSRTVLVLGVSGCLALPLVRLRAPRARIVTNIDGLEWKRRKWGPLARLVLRLSEWSAVRFSDVVIADNPSIQNHVRSTYGKDAALIYYGGDHTSSSVLESATSQTRFRAGDYFLTICRIEPENNIREILLAFAAIPCRELVVVGNWSISEYSINLRNEFGTIPNIELKDPIYDGSHLQRLRLGAKAYVHGHSAGGTNPSLVEAMTSGLAVLAFDVDYNRYTTDNGAVYWASSSALSALIEATDKTRLSENAKHMTAIATCRYRWQTIIEQYYKTLFPDTTQPVEVVV
jgi:glycosyltransferase involved in cell wall biosynthesis